jgi:hypothetical protein
VGSSPLGGPTETVAGTAFKTPGLIAMISQALPARFTIYYYSRV